MVIGQGSITVLITQSQDPTMKVNLIMVGLIVLTFVRGDTTERADIDEKEATN